MDIITKWVSRAGEAKGRAFSVFIQRCANRLCMGSFRYDKGQPIRSALYLTRLKAEVKAYERTGNAEHLINASNYCHLEMEAPEHPDFHFRSEKVSATRDTLRMKL